jgi:hypothetical protein
VTDAADLARRRKVTAAEVAQVLAQVADTLERHEKRLDALYDRLL